jgi:hypothetical protein
MMAFQTFEGGDMPVYKENREEEKKNVSEKSAKFKDFMASKNVELNGLINNLKKDDPNITKAFLKKVVMLVWLSSESDDKAVDGVKRLFSIATVKSIANLFSRMKLAPSSRK